MKLSRRRETLVASAGSLDASAVNLVGTERGPKNNYPCRSGIVADSTNNDEFRRVGRMTLRRTLFIYIYIYIE